VAIDCKKLVLDAQQVPNTSFKEFFDLFLEPFQIKIVEKDLSIDVQEFYGMAELGNSDLKLDLARQDLYSDWNIYKGIIFHLIQNAIKFSTKGNTIKI